MRIRAPAPQLIRSVGPTVAGSRRGWSDDLSVPSQHPTDLESGVRLDRYCGWLGDYLRLPQRLVRQTDERDLHVSGARRELGERQRVRVDDPHDQVSRMSVTTVLVCAQF